MPTFPAGTPIAQPPDEVPVQGGVVPAFPFRPRTLPLRAGFLFLLLNLLTACADASVGDAAGSAATESSSSTAGARSSLVVVLERGDGTKPERFTLVCGREADGSHPQAEAACEHLMRLDAPLAPLPANRVCTQIFGGPQTARVDGVWLGEPVHVELSRVNGCRIAQWDRLGPLLPGPIGGASPIE
jgi:hypothetical protein